MGTINTGIRHTTSVPKAVLHTFIERPQCSIEEMVHLPETVPLQQCTKILCAALIHRKISIPAHLPS